MLKGVKKYIAKISFFKRIIIGYFLILLIPAITWIVSYNTSRNIIEEEISRSNQVLLQYGLKEMDMNFASGRSILYKVMGSSNLLNCLQKEKSETDFDGYMELMLREYLSTFMADYISDIIVFFHQSNRVVSANRSILSSELYYDSYYASLENSYEEWLDTFHGSSGYLTLYKASSSPTLGVMQKYPMNEKNTSVSIAVIFNSQSIQDYMEELIENNTTSIFAVNNKEIPLIYGGEEIDYLSLEEENTGDDYVIDRETGDKYVYQISESEESGLKYVSLVHYSVFWEKLHSLRMFNYISYGIFLVVSFFAVVFLSRMAYKPLGNFISNIKVFSGIEYDKHEDTEMKYLNHVFDVTMKEKEFLGNRMASERVMLAEDIMLKASQGIITLEEDMIETLKDYEVNMPYQNFVVGVFKIDAWDSSMIPNLRDNDIQIRIKRQIKDTGCDVFGKSTSINIVRVERRKYISIINLDKSMEDINLIECFQTIKALLEKKLGILFTIGISNAFTDKKLLHDGYIQATEAMEYRAAFGRGIVIPYQNIENRVFSYISSNVETQKKILSLIKEKEYEKTPSQLVEDLIETNINEETATLEVFRCFRLDMMGIIAKIMNEICSPLYISEHAFIDQLISCETFFDFKIELIKILEELKDNESEHQSENDLSNLVMTYIMENYSNPDLNVNKLGEVFQITPSYLSRVFKEQNGMSPLDFITKLRINTAKELIEDDENTIESIAQKVGFLSSSVFIRSFKKVEGITPGAYKKIKKI